jgi:arsenate reductase (thioredoxin)
MIYRVVFLCPHGAAKSILAASYCQRLADQQSVPLHAIAAGTDPDVEVSPAVVELLRAEGIEVAGQRPRQATHEELATASLIISLGCDLGELVTPGMPIERWDDVPPPTQNLLLARDQIRTHVEQLITTFKHASQHSPAASKERVNDNHD